LALISAKTSATRRESNAIGDLPMMRWYRSGQLLILAGAPNGQFAITVHLGKAGIGQLSPHLISQCPVEPFYIGWHQDYGCKFIAHLSDPPVSKSRC